MNTRVSEKELLRGHESLDSAVQLEDCDYIAVLAVYHELQYLVRFTAPRPDPQIEQNY